SFLLGGGVPPLPNVVLPGQGPMPLVDVTTALARAAVTWDDLRWLGDAWRGPIVVKGVLTGEDARRAADAGAAAIVVSNHGGRQLDGVRAALRAPPEGVTAENGQADVLKDGGGGRGGGGMRDDVRGRRAGGGGRADRLGL